MVLSVFPSRPAAMGQTGGQLPGPVLVCDQRRKCVHFPFQPGGSSVLSPQRWHSEAWRAMDYPPTTARQGRPGWELSTRRTVKDQREWCVPGISSPPVNVQSIGARGRPVVSGRCYTDRCCRGSRGLVSGAWQNPTDASTYVNCSCVESHFHKSTLDVLRNPFSLNSCPDVAMIAWPQQREVMS